MTENDYGNYSCIATNMFGSSTATIEVYNGEISSELVKVKDVPSLIPVSFHFVIVLYYVFISCVMVTPIKTWILFPLKVPATMTA